MAQWTFIDGYIYGNSGGTLYSPDSLLGGGSTLDDGEADTTFEAGEPTSGGSYNYIGQIEIFLTAGGSFMAPVIEYDGFPNAIALLMPEGVTEAELAGIPDPIDLSTIDTSDFLACFGAGTPIATPGGEVPVEDLTIGDLVRTADGRDVPVLWVGRQRLDPLRHQRQPLVRIRAGALGDGLPHADLVVTGDHGMILDAHVVTAAALVGAAAIDWVSVDALPKAFCVYHVETEAHDVILAAGAASETFIDAAGRAAFDNHDEYLAAYGAERIVPEMRLPRVTSARLLPGALRDRFGARAPDAGAGWQMVAAK